MIYALLRLHAFTAFTLVSGAILLSTQSHASIYDQCAENGALSDGALKLCVTTDYSAYRFTQWNERGMLVVEIDRYAVNDGVPGPDGSTLVRLTGQPARIAYCSAESLFSKKTGEATCGANLSTTGDDPTAFTGIGNIYGDLRIDPWGKLACPSSINVTGRVSAPGNATFAVTSSAVFAESPAMDCESVYRNVDLRFVGPAGETQDEQAEELEAMLEKLSGVKQDQWDAVEALSQLDDQEFQVLTWLLNADDQQISKVADILSRGDEAYVLADGAVIDAANFDALGIEAGQAMAIDFATAAGILDRILSIVKTIRSTANSTLSTIRTRLPDRPDFRDLVDTLPFARLQDMIAAIKDIIDPVISVVTELRNGFDEFKGADCSGGSPCAVFQNDIDNLFANVEFLFLSSQQMICFDNPNFNTRSIDTSRIANLVKKMPLLLQYGISQALTQVDFDWTLNDIASQLPTELGELCNDNANLQASATKIGFNYANSNSSSSAAIQEFKAAATPQGREIAKCKIARNMGFLGGGQLGILDAGTRGIDQMLQVMSLIGDSSDIVVKSQKDDIQVTIAGVAVGGGGGGTNVKNYLKAILEIAKILIGRIEFRLNKLRATYSACLSADDTIERDLLACNVKVSFLVDGKESQWPFINNLVGRRINTAKSNGFSGIALAKNARARANELMDAEKQRKAYQCMCNAYQYLVLPKNDVLACEP